MPNISSECSRSSAKPSKHSISFKSPTSEISLIISCRMFPFLTNKLSKIFSLKSKKLRILLKKNNLKRNVKLISNTEVNISKPTNNLVLKETGTIANYTQLIALDLIISMNSMLNLSNSEEELKVPQLRNLTSRLPFLNRK